MREFLIGVLTLPIVMYAAYYTTWPEFWWFLLGEANVAISICVLFVVPKRAR